MGRLPKNLKEIEDAKTFKEKIYEIITDTYFDPENGTDQIVKLVRKIIKVEIKNLQKAMSKASESGNTSLAANYAVNVWLLIWILDNKFDIKKKKEEKY